MPDSITISHAQEVVSHISQLGENKYSSIVAAANDTEKEKLKKTAIGTRMADLKPDEVTLVGADDNQITKQELVDTFNRELTKNGGAALTQKQIDYLWNTSIVAIKDPGESAATTNSPATVPNSSSTTPAATVPSSPIVTPATKTPTLPPVLKPIEDTEAPTLSSSSPSNGATDIAKNSNIDLTFSENITLADAAKVKLFKKSDNSEVEDITTSVVNGNTLRIKPKAELEDSTEYYVTVESAAVTDASKNKNAYAGITANTDLSFTTGTTVLTTEEQAAADAAAKKNQGVLTTGVTQPSSNNFNKPVTKLNLDDNPNVQSDGEKKLGELVNLRYGLDLLESKEDVHVALGREEDYVKEALESLRTGNPTSEFQTADYYDNYEEGKTPEHYRAFVLKQAIEDYKKIDPKIAEKAEKARDKEIKDKDPDIPDMSEDDKAALIKVFENYQNKFTAQRKALSEAKLKKYLIDNYDSLKDRKIDGFPATGDKAVDTNTIKDMSKDDIINLSIKVRDKITTAIKNNLSNKTFTPEAQKAFLKKYMETDFSNSEKSIEFVKSLSDEELLMLNRYRPSDENFISRDFIIRELGQHKLSLQDTLGLHPSYLDAYPSPLITLSDREALLKKYDNSITDLTKKKDFINNLSPEELVVLALAAGKALRSKAFLLSELEAEANKTKSLDEVLGLDLGDLGSHYVSNLADESVEFGGTNAYQAIITKLRDTNIWTKLEQDKSISLLEQNVPQSKYTSNLDDGSNFAAKIYTAKGVGQYDALGYLVQTGTGDNKYKLYTSQEELLGLPDELKNEDNQFIKLAKENWGINYDTPNRTYDTNSLLRLSQNAARLKSPGTTNGTKETNTLHTILEKIYASEEKALKTKEETTEWHEEMKRRVAKLLMSSSDDEFVKNREEFQKYLNDTYSGINGWIDGLRKEFNSADAQTETMLREVQQLLATSHDSKIKPTTTP
jgi:methionine-rich copper-binding protein CopC